MWYTDKGIEIKDLLQKSPNLSRHFEGTKLLLDGDGNGLKMLLENPPIRSTGMNSYATVLKDNGFYFAFLSLKTIAPDLPGKKIHHLLQIPKDKREPVQEVFLNSINGPQNMSMYANTALQMLCNPPEEAQDINSQELYELTLELGENTGIVSFNTAELLFRYNKNVEALDVISKIIIADPTNDLLVNMASGIVYQIGGIDAVSKLYEQSLVTVPEPKRHNMRVAYLSFLKTNNDIEKIELLSKGNDRLLAAAALVFLGNLEAATKIYLPMVNDSRAPVEVKISAWIGLLDADVDKALSLSENLLKELAAIQNNGEKEALTHFLAMSFWGAYSRDLPKGLYNFSNNSLDSYARMSEVEDWQGKSALIVDSLLKISPDACFKIDNNTTPNSFREPAAVIYILNNDSKKALDVLSYEFTYEIAPPAGGWRLFDGTLRPDHDKPVTAVTPSPTEWNKSIQSMMNRLSYFKNMNVNTYDFCTVLQGDLNERRIKSEDRNINNMYINTNISLIQYFFQTVDNYYRRAESEEERELIAIDLKELEEVYILGLDNKKISDYNLDIINKSLGLFHMIKSDVVLDVLANIVNRSLNSYSHSTGQSIEILKVEKERIANYIMIRKDVDMSKYKEIVLQ